MLSSIAIALSLLGAEDKAHPIPGLEDTVSLLRLEANPRAAVGQFFVICGAIRSQSYYNYYYSDMQKVFYSLGLSESGKDTKTFTEKGVSLYLPRQIGAPIMERLLQMQEKQALEGERKPIICQAKVILDPDAYREDKQWDLLEVYDVRFIKPDFSGFEPWVLQSLVLKGKASRTPRRSGTTSTKAAPKKPEPLPLRTWTDSTGQHKTTARFAGLAMGNVTLELESGKTVTVPLERLSKEDQEYIKQRR